jgi:hypothetical protein
MGGELAQALGAEAWQPPRYEPVEEERGIWEEAIAQADPAYIAGAAQQMMAAHVGLRWRLGFGCIGIYGAPGTGKNALLREVAAAWRVPIFSVDLSAGLDLVRPRLRDITKYSLPTSAVMKVALSTDSGSAVAEWLSRFSNFAR